MNDSDKMMLGFVTSACVVLFVFLMFVAFSAAYNTFYIPPYQEIPVECDEIVRSGEGVECWWNGKSQTFYDCTHGTEVWSDESCEFFLCKKDRNIGVLLRSRHP